MERPESHVSGGGAAPGREGAVAPERGSYSAWKAQLATRKVLNKVSVVLMLLRSRWFFTSFQYVELCCVILFSFSARAHLQRSTFTVNTFQPGCWPQLLMNDSGAHFYF